MADPVASTPNQIADSNPNIVNNAGNGGPQTPTQIAQKTGQAPPIYDSKGNYTGNAAVTNLKNQNATGLNTTADGTGSVISTSAPVVADENTTIQNVQDATGNNQASIDAHNAYVQGIADQTTALENQRTNAINQINNSFNQQNTTLQNAQKGETGTFSATLARIGGYIGDSASSAGAMINLNNTHVAQVNDLESKRQDAIQTANNAINDKQFALAQAKMQEAKDYAKEIQTNKQTFFDNQIKILDEQKTKQAAADQAAKDQAINALISPTDGSKPITDPSQILSKLNGNGLNISATDVQNVLKSFAESTGGTLSTVTNATQAFNYFKQHGGLSATVLALPTESQQYIQFLKEYNATSSAVTVAQIKAGGNPGSGAGIGAINIAQNPAINLVDLTTPLKTVIDTVGMDKLVQAVITNEGGTPQGTNNPGNVKFANQAGATQGKAAPDGGFYANFATKQQGLDAISNQISIYANQGKTFQDAFNAYTGTSPINGLTNDQTVKLAKINLTPIQQENVAGIFNGTRPPLSGFGVNSKEGQAVSAGLNALGYNLTKATEDWNAMTKRIATMNGPQQVKLQQAISFSSDSLNIVDQLNEAWKGGGFPLVNKADLTAAAQGVDNTPLDTPLTISVPSTDGGSQSVTITDKQGLATLLTTQISDLTSELGTVYKGGNTSTDESLSLASNNLNSNWSYGTLKSAIDLARTNLKIRQNSISASQNIPGNQYSPDATALKTSGGGVDYSTTAPPALTTPDQGTNFWSKAK